MVRNNSQASQKRAVGEMGFGWLCDDVVVYIKNFIFLIDTEEVGIYICCP